MFGTFENFILGLVSIALAWLIAVLFMKQYLGISLKQSVIGNTIYTAIATACEMIVYYSIQQLINLPVYDDINNANGAFFIELLSLMLAFVIVVIVSAFLRRSALARLEPKHWFLIIVFPLKNLNLL